MLSTSEAFIDIKSVDKRYLSGAASVVALQDITLGINAGEFISIIGPSGCGKSTLMMIAAGLTSHQRGQVKIGGVPVVEPYTNVGIVFQSHELLEWRTALENILLQIEVRKLNVKEYEPKAMELLGKMGLRDFASKYPSELSGGMRQRVSICRALIHDPKIILMDEPFGALDALTRDQLILDLQKIWSKSGKTVILITHSIEEAVFLSDRVVVMTPRPGQIREEIEIDLPRPRHLSIKQTPEFGKYAIQLRRHFESLGVLHDD